MNVSMMIIVGGRLPTSSRVFIKGRRVFFGSSTEAFSSAASHAESAERRADFGSPNLPKEREREKGKGEAAWITEGREIWDQRCVHLGSLCSRRCLGLPKRSCECTADV